nr:MAG TPA: hypothetical protein [Caudoviricetes sp.]
MTKLDFCDTLSNLSLKHKKYYSLPLCENKSFIQGFSLLCFSPRVKTYVHT